jgi:two-component system response regulator RegA
MGDTGAIRSVLVVDDDERVVSTLARSLRHHCAVATARAPAEAIAIAQQMKPDLVVVDLQLGEHSGLELLRTIKSELPTARTVLLSGYLSVDTTVAAVRAGADLVLAKPVRAMELLRRAELRVANGDEPITIRTPTLAEAVSQHISRVMSDCGGNVSEAARRLGIYRSSLQRKLRKLTPLT